jgi:hypothetical protein
LEHLGVSIIKETVRVVGEGISKDSGARRLPALPQPTGECKPASVWIKADRLHPLIPRETPRFTALYGRRASVARELGAVPLAA